MIKIRKAAERGTTKLGWVESYHTFSFGDYYDPQYMGFGVLRVINEDKVRPISGFDTHPHRNMEIITYVLEGELEHQDTLGMSSIITSGDVQCMSAGTGIMHSEYNPQTTETVHLLQIWIVPERMGLTPSYEQKNFSNVRQSGKLTLLASPNGHENSLKIHQDASLSVLDLDFGQTFTYSSEEDRMIWVQVARGIVELNGHLLEHGDGAALVSEKILEFQGKSRGEILIFNLPVDSEN